MSAPQPRPASAPASGRPDVAGPAIDVVDSTWIGAGAATVGAVLVDPARWARWWPGLRLAVCEARGPKGVRWLVTGAPAGTVGSMEIWLEPALDGVVAHFFLRLDRPGRRRLGRRRAARLGERYRVAAKRALWAVGNEVDPGRLARLAAPGPADGSR